MRTRYALDAKTGERADTSISMMKVIQRISPKLLVFPERAGNGRPGRVYISASCPNRSIEVWRFGLPMYGDHRSQPRRSPILRQVTQYESMSESVLRSSRSCLRNSSLFTLPGSVISRPTKAAAAARAFSAGSE